VDITIIVIILMVIGAISYFLVYLAPKSSLPNRKNLDASISDLAGSGDSNQALVGRANNGDISAILDLGNHQLYVVKDVSRAKEWYLKAVSLGSFHACLRMANCCNDIHEYFEWRLKAAEAGDRDSYYWVSQAYKDGRGVLKNFGRSTYWLILSAENGRANSMLELAHAYAEGFGIEENPTEALAWLQVAEFKGSPDAAELSKALERRLNNSLVLMAQNRAKLILELIQEGKSTQGTAMAGSRAADGSNSVSVKPKHSPKGSGSGSVVSVDGHVVTAAHVLKGASYVEVVTSTGTLPAIVLNVDEANDLALLKVEQAFATHIRLGRSSNVRLGQTVSTIGFPNIGIQGHSPKVTQGMVSGENGIQNDIRMWQISVPIQPGNSGGPLLDEKGLLIGVVVATLSLRAIQITGSVPQNVNYAIKGAYLEPMLGFHKLKPSKDEAEQVPSFQDMVAEAQKSAVLVLVY
jgi:S1-C subfamily serine protease